MIEQYTFQGFLIVCVIALAGFIRFLVRKVIKLVEENTQAFKDLQGTIANNNTAVNDLRQTINSKR